MHSFTLHVNEVALLMGAQCGDDLAWLEMGGAEEDMFQNWILISAIGACEIDLEDDGEDRRLQPVRRVSSTPSLIFILEFSTCPL